jgi:predicted metalloprotease
MVRFVSCVASVIAIVATSCGSSDDSSGSGETTTVGTGDLVRLPEVAEPSASTRPPSSQPGAGRNAFLRAVFDDVQTMWNRDFADGDVPYRPARLIIFVRAIETACGTQSARVGPFYCPADRTVYLDNRFFDALARQAGVGLGDFAQAYVMAHEVAHHVQFVLGIGQRLAAADQLDPAGKNRRSVRFELQADCLAGVWMHSRYRRGELTQTDLNDALDAAAVVGSDFQQRSATGTIRPEDWTHGSSAQRQHWLAVGFEEGRPGACDTFSG